MLKTKTIYIFGFSVLFFVAIVFLFFNVKNQINKKIEVVKEYRLREFKNKSADFSTRLKKDFEELAVQEQVFKEVFLESKNIVEFITILEREGQSMNLEVAVDKVDRADSEKISNTLTVQKASLSVTVQGSYQSIEEFIQKINQINKQLNIKDFRIYKIGLDTETEYSAKFIIEILTTIYE